MLLNKLSIKHIIKKPINKKNYPPLFLMIHGYGSNEKDLFSLHKDIPEKFFIISIQGIYPMSKEKYSWYNINFQDQKNLSIFHRLKIQLKKYLLL